MGVRMTRSTANLRGGAEVEQVVQNAIHKRGLLHCSTTLPPLRGVAGVVEQRSGQPRSRAVVEQKRRGNRP